MVADEDERKVRGRRGLQRGSGCCCLTRYYSLLALPIPFLTVPTGCGEGRQEEEGRGEKALPRGAAQEVGGGGAGQGEAQEGGR